MVAFFMSWLIWIVALLILFAIYSAIDNYLEKKKQERDVKLIVKVINKYIKNRK
jgi:biopolymer transport protein ExbB/TolQ